jgi:hypothetical protein
LGPAKPLGKSRHRLLSSSPTLPRVRGCGVPRLHQAHLARGSVTRRRRDRGINRLATGRAEYRRYTDPCCRAAYHRAPRRAASRSRSPRHQQSRLPSAHLHRRPRPFREIYGARFGESRLALCKYRLSARSLFPSVNIVRPRDYFFTLLVPSVRAFYPYRPSARFPHLHRPSARFCPHCPSARLCPAVTVFCEIHDRINRTRRRSRIARPKRP